MQNPAPARVLSRGFSSRACWKYFILFYRSIETVGTKLKKVVTDASSLITTEYEGNYVYENGALQFFSTAEGYVEPVSAGSTTFVYVFQYKKTT